MYLKLALFQEFTVMSLQGFSQEGVQLSYECPFLEELQGKIHLISYNFMGIKTFLLDSQFSMSG